MGEHSRLSPSSSSRWLTCTASVQAIEDDIEAGIIVPDTRPDEIANPAAWWGTQCHTVSEMLLLNESYDAILEAVPLAETDDELGDTASAYVNYCQNLMREGSVMLVEHRVGLGRWIPNEVVNEEGEEEEQGGTADCIIIHTDSTIDMVDLKAGMGMVFAEENPQLKIYSGGILDEYELLDDIKEIRTHIVQPRRDHYDVVTYKADTILGWMSHVVYDAANQIATGRTKFAPSEKACQWCPRSGYCEAQTKQISSDVIADIDDMEAEELELSDPDKLTVKQLTKIQSKSAEIIAFLKSVEKRIEERLNAGKKTTGFKLVEKNTNRKWGSSEESIAKTLEAMGLDEDEIWATKLNTLSAIEKKLNAKQKKQLAAHITKPQGAITIAPTSDKRPAIKPMLTQDEMSEIKDNG